MMTWICAFLLTLFSGPSEDVNNRADVQELHNYACAYSDIFYGISCGDLEAPIVVTSKVVPPNYYGFYYRNEPYIFVNISLGSEQWNLTVVHETMHYILDHKNAGLNRCESEEAARRVDASWAGIKYNDKWRRRYNCEVE